MFDLPGPLGTFANFLVIALGFGFIIFIHELGHFLAAKWAGIRVLAFSIGFGNVLCSYRKGVGFQRGSSDQIYANRVRAFKGSLKEFHSQISPTEYRLSMLPLGGYVKMLGQEDLNPEAVSEEPDSYQNCAVGKRMVVISAGVIMNVISAALLFIIVFTAGLRVFPAQVGFVPEGSPASMAISTSNPELDRGLKRGDRIKEINNKIMHSYEAVLPEIAMSSKGRPATILVERDGVDGLVTFEVTPVKSPQSGLLDIGIAPPMSTSLKGVRDDQSARLWEMFASNYGFSGLEPGDTFVTANDQPVKSPLDLLDLAEASGGQSISTTIERDGETISHSLQPVRELQTDLVELGESYQLVDHLLGLTGVMMIDPSASPEDTMQGLEPGDIFAKLGNINYPTQARGIAFVRSNSGESVDVVVLREDEQGLSNRVKLTVDISQEGRIGFYPTTTTSRSNYVGSPPTLIREVETDTDNADSETEQYETAAVELIQYPGSRITKVGDTPIVTLRDLPSAVMDSIQDAYETGADLFEVEITLELPLPLQPDGSVPTTQLSWSLTRAEIDEVADLGYTLPGSLEIATMFDYQQIIDKADGPVAAINRGISESRRVMQQTYLTFLRLFEGSVQVKHLKGPVGIAHLGTQIASQGWVWVLFFMALISINLAVINFLPLPIVDGGQFLMLVYEWLRGRPVPVVVQNVATMAGLLVIGSIFLFVTFNDVKAIFGV
jgi:regulator of sigma E protease